MTIFGDGSTFAIEAIVDEVHGSWIYASLRFWVAGRELGEFDDTSDLASSANWGRVFLAASSRRTSPDMDPLGADRAYWMLYGRFFDNSESPIEELERDPYLLDDIGESSLRDRVSVLVVRRADGCDRIIVNEYNVRPIWEHILLPGVCDSVVAAYCAWVDTLRA